MKKHLFPLSILCAVIFSLGSCTKSPCDTMADALEEMVEICCKTETSPKQAIAAIKAVTEEIKKATAYAKENPAAAQADMHALKSSNRFRAMANLGKGFGHSFEMMLRLNPDVQAAFDEMNEAMAEFAQACK